MNWYRLANIYDDLKRYGPRGEAHPTDEQLLNLGRTPEQYQEYPRDFQEWTRRDQYIQDYGWSVPNEESIDKLVEFINNDSVLEIGAGYGLWAKLLQEKGVNITATDIQQPLEGSRYKPENKRYFHIDKLNHMEALQKYQGYNVLMMVWPPYDDPMANDVLKAFDGNKLIYVGEGNYGCTGDECFHSQLDKEWKNVGYIDIPKWEGIGDSAMIYVRK